MYKELLLTRRQDRTAIITLNRPEKMNAINRTMVRELASVINAVDADPEINVVIINSSCEKAFCVGVDLAERQTMSDEEAEQFRLGEMFPMFRRLDKRRKPAIAVVNGHCLAGGLEIALACDLIIADDSSTFGLPEVKWGLVPAAGGCRKLPKLIGAVRAKEMILCASKISADKALSWGLINQVVEKEKLLEVALDLANQINSNAQSAVQGAKRCIDNGVDAAAACDFDMEVSNFCYSDKARKSGVAQFGQK